MVMRMKELNKTFVLQHDASDCGVACLLSIIRYYGGSTTLQYLRELSGTTKQGTTLLGLYQAAGQVGFDATGYRRIFIQQNQLFYNYILFFFFLYLLHQLVLPS